MRNDVEKTSDIKEEMLRKAQARRLRLLDELREVEELIELACGGKDAAKIKAPGPIYDVEEFLNERGEPTLQSEIVRVVAERRLMYRKIKNSFRKGWHTACLAALMYRKTKIHFRARTGGATVGDTHD